jgi:Transposase IS66 family
VKGLLWTEIRWRARIISQRLSCNRNSKSWGCISWRLGILSPKSETAAIRYALSRWRAVTRYAEDGLFEIDNNSAERALHVVALERKNYVFAGLMRAENVLPPRPTRCWKQLSSTAWTGSCISSTCSHRFPIIPSSASTISCRGTSPLNQHTHK